MSLLFIDSFDHYNKNSMAAKWDAVTLLNTQASITAIGRGGGSALLFTPSVSRHVSKTINTAQTVIAGFAMAVYEYGENARTAFFALTNLGTIKLNYALNGDGTLDIWRGQEQTGTLLGRTAKPLKQGVWYFVETQNKIDSDSGYIEIRIDGTAEFTFAGNTLSGTSKQADAIAFGREDSIIGVRHQIAIDDLYVCDNQGTRNNGFLGDVRVIALMPNSDGDTIQWDPSTTGTNYQMINGTIPDSDRTYNSTSVTAEIDTFHMGNLGIGSAYVHAVQAVFMARQDDPSRTMRPLLTTNGSLYAGATVALTGSQYTFIQEIFELNPVTATSWTVAEVDSHQAGYELVA